MTRPNTDDLAARDAAAVAAQQTLLERMLYARNPFLVQMQAEQPGWVREAQANGPAPTLFPQGDLPWRTQSGIPVEDLLRLPWFLRHAYAEADLATAYALEEAFGKWDDAAAALFESGAAGFDLESCEAANEDYKFRFQSWLRAARVAAPLLETQSKAIPAGEAIARASAAYMRLSGKTPEASVMDVLARTAGKDGPAAYRELVEYGRDFATGTTPAMVEATRKALGTMQVTLEESAAGKPVARRLAELAEAAGVAAAGGVDELYEAVYGPGSSTRVETDAAFDEIYGRQS